MLSVRLAPQRPCGKKTRAPLGTRIECIVCVDVIGNLIKPNYVSSTFGKLLAKNNLRHIRFHDLRHTCASLLLANGVPMEQVKEWLGHSEISTTVDIYGHLQYATKKQSAAAIEQDIVAPMLQNLSAVSP